MELLHARAGEDTAPVRAHYIYTGAESWLRKAYEEVLVAAFGVEDLEPLASLQGYFRQSGACSASEQYVGIVLEQGGHPIAITLFGVVATARRCVMVGEYTAVHRKFRRRGVGAALARLREVEANRVGRRLFRRATTMYVVTVTDAEKRSGRAAREFWERRGYRELVAPRERGRLARVQPEARLMLKRTAPLPARSTDLRDLLGCMTLFYGLPATPSPGAALRRVAAALAVLDTLDMAS